LTRPSLADRRRALRLACALSVQYRTRAAWRPASVLDLSDGGCRLRIGEELASGAAIEVRLGLVIHDGMSAASVEVPGNVAWCRREGLSNQTGIRFSESPAVLAELLQAIDRV